MKKRGDTVSAGRPSARWGRELRVCRKKPHPLEVMEGEKYTLDPIKRHEISKNFPGRCSRTLYLFFTLLLAVDSGMIN